MTKVDNLQFDLQRILLGSVRGLLREIFSLKSKKSFRRCLAPHASLCRIARRMLQDHSTDPRTGHFTDPFTDPSTKSFHGIHPRNLSAEPSARTFRGILLRHHLCEKCFKKIVLGVLRDLSPTRGIPLGSSVSCVYRAPPQLCFAHPPSPSFIIVFVHKPIVDKSISD